MTRRQQLGYMFAAIMAVPWLAYLLYNPMWFVAKLIVGVPFACLCLWFAGREYRGKVLATHRRLDMDAESQHAALMNGEDEYGTYGLYTTHRLPYSDAVLHAMDRAATRRPDTG